MSDENAQDLTLEHNNNGNLRDIFDGVGRQELAPVRESFLLLSDHEIGLLRNKVVNVENDEDEEQETNHNQEEVVSEISDDDMGDFDFDESAETRFIRKVFENYEGDHECLEYEHCPKRLPKNLTADLNTWRKYSKFVSIIMMDAEGGDFIREVPDCIIELQNIIHIGFDGNGLRLRNISNNLWNLVTLEDLNIDNCIIGKLPEEIGNLVNLKEFFVRNNNLNSLPSGLWNCRKLVRLYLGSNGLREIPDALGENLKNLECLGIENCSLKSIPHNFMNLKKLTHFGCEHNELTTLPNIFDQMPGMRFGDGYLCMCNNSKLTSLPDSIRFVKNALSRSNSNMREHAPLLAMVDLRYQRWCDRKPLLLMKPKKGVDLKKHAAKYEVLFARLDNQYGDPARSSGFVQHIASFLGPIPNHVTDEAIEVYQSNQWWNL